MKKLVSLVLCISIVCSLFIIPVVPVTATETTLFKADTQSSPYTLGDYSSLTTEDLADQNITIGGANIYMSTSSAVPITPSMTVSEDGKTLTLNNFSFGATDNANAEYEIKGGTVTANYGFFQHGKYALRSNFETGYMYYSYGSDITVYGTFHSQGKGDGLDYVRGKLTIAKGGKSIHDKSLWVGQPANWGAMNASLVIEEGGYVQANSEKMLFERKIIAHIFKIARIPFTVSLSVKTDSKDKTAPKTQKIGYTKLKPFFKNFILRYSTLLFAI